MAPTIHLVRHAQGFHNLCVENEMIPDPTLTPLGDQQCADLKASFPFHEKITKIISSPLRRTILTSMAAFGRDDLYPITAVDTLQEVSTLPSDTGSPVNVLEAVFGDKVDLSRVSKDWTVKTPGSLFQPNIEKLEERAKSARLSIRDIVDMNSDEHVVVVTHGDYLHFLTKDWQGVPELGFYVWKNGEYRSYQFDTSSENASEADLIETDQSWQRRHGNATRPSDNDQTGWREPSYTKLRPEYAAMA